MYAERYTWTETVHSPENLLYFIVQILDFEGEYFVPRLAAQQEVRESKLTLACLYVAGNEAENRLSLALGTY